MHIYHKYTGPLRPETDRTASLAGVSTLISIHPFGISPTDPDRIDRARTSDTGRSFGVRVDTRQLADLDPARAARIRYRVLAGAYDTPEMVDAVSRRLLDAGDL